MYLHIDVLLAAHMESGGANMVTEYLHRMDGIGQVWTQCTLIVPVSTLKVAQRSQGSTCDTQDISQVLYLTVPHFHHQYEQNSRHISLMVVPHLFNECLTKALL